jgi:hypothetical protein
MLRTLGDIKERIDELLKEYPPETPIDLCGADGEESISSIEPVGSQFSGNFTLRIYSLDGEYPDD